MSALPVNDVSKQIVAAIDDEGLRSEVRATLASHSIGAEFLEGSSELRRYGDDWRVILVETGGNVHKLRSLVDHLHRTATVFQAPRIIALCQSADVENDPGLQFWLVGGRAAVCCLLVVGLNDWKVELIHFLPRLMQWSGRSDSE